MSRPKVTDRELKDFRFPMMLSKSEVKAIDDWMFAHRLGSRGEAVRRLVTLGLRSSKSIGDVVLENELEAELAKRCAADPAECPSFLWESILAERGIEA